MYPGFMEHTNFHFTAEKQTKYSSLFTLKFIVDEKIDVHVTLSQPTFSKSQYLKILNKYIKYILLH